MKENADANTKKLSKNNLLNIKAVYIENEKLYQANLEDHVSNYEKLGKNTAIELKKNLS